MTIDRPQPAQIPQLRALWQEAFGDTDGFLDVFFSLGFAPERCRCITQGDSVTAALYWFDCRWENRRLAYFYAVATAKRCQGQGLCRMLMEDTHRHLLENGYDGCILVPQSPGLFSMYEKLGYHTCSHVREFSCASGETSLPLKQIGADEYATARKALLPPDSVLQEGATLAFLAGYATLYAGSNVLFAAYPDEEKLIVCELLGNAAAAPSILNTLGFAEGKFRVPGQEKPYAMYHPLTPHSAMPGYLGLALD